MPDLAQTAEPGPPAKPELPPNQAMNRFMRVTVLLGSVTVLSLAIQIVRTKLMALEVGRAGMSLVAQFSDFQIFISGFLLLGAEQGLVAVAADAYGHGRPEAVAQVLRIVRRRVVPWALLAIVLLTAASPWLLPHITGQPDYVLPGAIAVAALCAQLLIRPWQAIINGAKAFKLMARLRLAESGIGLALLVPLVLVWHVEGAIYSIAAMQVTSLAITWWAWRKLAPPQVDLLSVATPEQESAARTLTRFGVATLFAMAISNGMNLALRREIISLHGLDTSGLYQVAYSLTQQYLVVVLGAMSTYSFPAYRAVHAQPEALSNEINHTLRGAVLIIVPIIATLLILRVPLLLILFSRDYLPAEGMLRLQLLGDLFKVVAWAIGLAILASGRTRTHILLEVLFGATWLAGVWAWSQVLGPLGPPTAFLANQVFMCFVYWAILHRYMGFRLSRQNLLLIGASTTTLAAIALTSGLPLLANAAIGVAVVGGWAGLCVQRSEIQTLVRYLRRRLPGAKPA